MHRIAKEERVFVCQLDPIGKRVSCHIKYVTLWFYSWVISSTRWSTGPLMIHSESLIYSHVVLFTSIFASAWGFNTHLLCSLNIKLVRSTDLRQYYTLYNRNQLCSGCQTVTRELAMSAHFSVCIDEYCRVHYLEFYINLKPSSITGIKIPTW